MTDHSPPTIDNFFTLHKLRWLRRVDRVMRRLVWARPSSRPPAIGESSQILLVESHHIGDHVMRMAAFRAIRARWPRARLALLTNRWGKELLASQGLFDEFFVTSIPWVRKNATLADWRAFAMVAHVIRQRRFEVAVDFRGDIRNNFLMFCLGAPIRVGYDFMGGDYLLSHSVPYTDEALSHEVEATNHVARFLGCFDVPSLPRFDLSGSEQQGIRERLDIQFPVQPGERRVGIYIVTGIKIKQWSLVEGRALLERVAADAPSHFLLFGDGADLPLLQSFQRELSVSSSIVQVPLAELPAALSLCDLFVGVDSGPAHIAEAVGVPTVVLFGSTLPELFGPRSPLARVIKASPCDCERQGRQTCSRPDGKRCLDLIGSDRVFDCLSQLVQANDTNRSRLQGADEAA